MTFSKTYTAHSSDWEESQTFPFTELILSWNGLRPTHSTWTFWVSLKPNEWLKYAEWAPDSQRSFKSVGAFAHCYQDVVIPKEPCHHFHIRIEGQELSQLHSLTVCLSNPTHHTLFIPQNLPPVHLSPVPRQSQLLLDHPRRTDLCSPTSTTTALRYLTRSLFDPVLFAHRVHDHTFDIYGNWILNVAEAYNQSRIPCHVERLSDFTALHKHLLQNRPVVVSVKGAIPGAPKPYNNGHLICVIGYESGRVYCIDSAFPDNASTHVSYALEDFLQAWGVRKNLAYVFNSGECGATRGSS